MDLAFAAGPRPPAAILGGCVSGGLLDAGLTIGAQRLTGRKVNWISVGTSAATGAILTPALTTRLLTRTALRAYRIDAAESAAVATRALPTAVRGCRPVTGGEAGRISAQVGCMAPCCVICSS
jgi:hypothetical protein